MRLGFAVMCALAVIVTMSIDANAQGPSKEGAGKDKAQATTQKTAPKGTMVLLCPKQSTGGTKVNVQCAQGEKCCYHPLFDNGSCVPQSEGCLGIVNPLPLVQR